jgi:hypothetical protein
VDRWINPYPLAPLNHLTVPFSLTKNSFRLFYVKFHGPREADASSQPPQNLWTKQPRLRAPLNSRATRKAPEFSAVMGEHGAKLWSLSW